MKACIFLTLPLAAVLTLPAIAQQSSTDNSQPATASSSSSSSNPQASSSTSPSTSQDAASDQNLSAHQPLQPEMRQGFWGKLNPMARKKYVQRQLSPIRDRVNELDDLTAANSKEIKDVDARAQAGIQQASAKASLADQHATDAGNRAQQANQTALQASNLLNTVEQVVGNIDQYQPATQTEIRFRPGQTVLGTKAKEALDDMTGNLKDQKGYIIEVQGFSPVRGQAGIQSSQAMANSVVRYLVEKNNVPVYRIFMMGLGNARVTAPEASSAKPAHGNRVEISLLKNNVEQLASAGQSNGEMNPNSDMQSKNYGSSTPSRQPVTPPQPSNNSSYTNSTPANSQSPQPQH